MSDQGVYSNRRPNTDNSEFNQLAFMMQQFINKINVATLAKVVAVDTVKLTVDLQPLVNLMSNDGTTPLEHAVIYSAPYFRLQGGGNAVICDPQVGDVGFAIFADEDISRVKNSLTVSNPGSRRRFSLSDALYIGGWCPQTTPTNYVKIGSEVEVQASAISTPTALKIDGKQVVGKQQAHITFTPGGANPDPVSQAAIQSILTVLQTHGLTA